MNIKKQYPISNSNRNTILLTKNFLLKKINIFKNLRTSLKKCYGRSKNTGQITVWHKQRGSKSLYRPLIRDKIKSKSILIGINYDPNRNSFVSVHFDLEKKIFFNDLFIKNTYPGSLIVRDTSSYDLKNGYRLLLTKIPTGTLISNISGDKYSNGKYAKAAGTFAQLIQKGSNSAKIKLPSNNIIQISNNNYATIGTVANELYRNIIIGKAGRNRNLGRRPIVRGIAMNPIDHPHGGRTNGGRPSVTPWGLPTKSKFRLIKKK